MTTNTQRPVRVSASPLVLLAAAVALAGCADADQSAAPCAPSLQVVVGFAELDGAEGVSLSSDKVEVRTTVRNTGTCVVNDIELDVDGPRGFSRSAGQIGALGPDDEATTSVEAPLNTSSSASDPAGFTVRAIGMSTAGAVAASGSSTAPPQGVRSTDIRHPRRWH